MEGKFVEYGRRKPGNQASTRPWISATPGGPEAQVGNDEQEKQIYGRQILGEQGILCCVTTSRNVLHTKHKEVPAKGNFALGKIASPIGWHSARII